MPDTKSVVRLDRALAYLDREIGRYDLNINPQREVFEEVEDYLARLNLPVAIDWCSPADPDTCNRQRKLVLLLAYEGDKAHPSYAIGGLSVRDVVIECVSRHQAHVAGEVA